jgi:hypothetical protein
MIMHKFYNTYHTFINVYSLCSLAKNLVPKLTRTAFDKTKAAYIPL